jgi:hypothetical protein
MGWVKDALRDLEETGDATRRPHGGSMRGRIESGHLVTLSAALSDDVAADDLALVRWRGNYLLQVINEVSGDRVLIGNNLGKINGWIPLVDVLAKVTQVED